MRLKIGIVPSQPFHISLGSDVRIIGLVRSLAKHGLDVYFITLFEPGPIVDEKNVTVISLSENSDNRLSDNIAKIGRSFLQKKTWANLALLSSLPLKLYLKRLSDRIQAKVPALELDILQGEQELAAYACAQVKKALNVKVSVDLHGIWPEELVSRGILKEHDLAFRSTRSFEYDLLNLCDFVITCSPEMKTFLRSVYKIDETKMFSLVPGSFPHDFPIGQKRTRTRRVVHAGLLSELENAQLLVKAMPLISERMPDVEFHLTKKGHLIRDVIKNIEKYDLNVNFFYYPKLSDFFEFLSSCDVAVLTSLPSVSRIMSYPAKLFDYMSVGLPIVANDIGGWGRIVRETKTGIMTKSSPEDLANGVINLLEDSDLAYSCHMNGIKAIRETYNWDRLVSSLVDFYHSRIDGEC
jgi:glycosyltransferase involved in cell wall biosynthesis